MKNVKVLKLRPMARRRCVFVFPEGSRNKSEETIYLNNPRLLLSLARDEIDEGLKAIRIHDYINMANNVGINILRRRYTRDELTYFFDNEDEFVKDHPDILDWEEF